MKISVVVVVFILSSKISEVYGAAFITESSTIQTTGDDTTIKDTPFNIFGITPTETMCKIAFKDNSMTIAFPPLSELLWTIPRPNIQGGCDDALKCGANECCVVTMEGLLRPPGECRPLAVYFCGRERKNRKGETVYEEFCDCADADEECVFHDFDSVGNCTPKNP